MARPTWTKVDAAESVKRSSQTVSVVGDKAYIFGGELAPRQPVDADIFAVKLNSGQDATQLAPVSVGSSEVPQPRVGAASTVLHDKIYVFSGRGGIAMAPIEENGSFWVFDSKADSWSELKPQDGSLPYPAGRSYHSLTSDGDNTIFLHAGCPEKGRLHDLWLFDVSERRWQELSPAPGTGRGGTSIAVSGKKLYRLNGFDGKTEQGGTLDVFDLDDKKWTTIQYAADGVSGPTPRSVSCLLSLDVEGKPSLVTMFGESDPSNLGHEGAGKMLKDFWVFDIGSEKWKKLEAEGGGGAPQPRGWFDADVIPDATQPKIVVHGGLAETNERIGDMWVLSF